MVRLIQRAVHIYVLSNTPSAQTVNTILARAVSIILFSIRIIDSLLKKLN